MRNVDGVVLQQPGELEAGHAGHHQVEDDDVGSVRSCGGEAGFAVEGALDRSSVLPRGDRGGTIIRRRASTDRRLSVG